MMQPFTYLPPQIDIHDAGLAAVLTNGLAANLLICAEDRRESLLALPDVGPEVASSIRNFFDSPANREQLARLKENGPWPKGADSAQGTQTLAEGPMAGKTILFTCRERIAFSHQHN